MHLLQIISPNIIRDKDFRKHLTSSGNDSSSEVLVVLSQALQTNNFERNVAQGSNVSHFRHVSDTQSAALLASCPKDLERKDVDVKVKLFLKSFEAEAPIQAIEAILKKIDCTFIDSLQLAVPEMAVACLGIGAEPKPKCQEYRSNLDRLVALWKQLEQKVLGSKVRSIGLCDVEMPTLKEVFDKATVKPTSITVNLKSCCVIPPALKEFAQTHQLQLLTHSDPEEILGQEKIDSLRDNKYFKDNEQIRFEWIARYQVMDRLRGVLKDKRYIMGLKAE